MRTMLAACALLVLGAVPTASAQVYTPPEARGRGFATALVAAVSRGLLAEGRPGCTLFTNLANPTSNAIYERIGYRRVGSAFRYGFATSEQGR